MDLFIKIYVVVIGLVIGSFLNVLIYRIPLKLSVVGGSSFCPSCNHKLIWIDLFPLFSFLFLRGKCRYCTTKISVRYPLIEALNAVCYYLIYLSFGLSFVTLLYFIISSSLLTLSMIDFDTKIIPDRFHIVIGACAVLVAFLSGNLSITERLIGLFAISLPLFIIVLITGGMGTGDVKLFAVCGFLLGWKLILLTMLIASVTAAVFGIVLMLMKKAERKTEMPFGPFIALGAFVCIIAGEKIISMYLSLILK